MFHFPFSVLHFSFAIEEAQFRQWQMKNVIRKMENHLFPAFSIFCLMFVN